MWILDLVLALEFVYHHEVLLMKKKWKKKASFIFIFFLRTVIFYRVTTHGVSFAEVVAPSSRWPSPSSFW